MMTPFLSRLLGKFGWLVVLFGVAFFVIGSLTYLRGEDGLASREGGGFLAIIGALMLILLIVNALRKGRVQ